MSKFLDLSAWICSCRKGLNNGNEVYAIGGVAEVLIFGTLHSAGKLANLYQRSNISK
jgi:hypothetical protein